VGAALVLQKLVVVVGPVQCFIILDTDFLPAKPILLQ
jgi:hypothetical protein